MSRLVSSASVPTSSVTIASVVSSSGTARVQSTIESARGSPLATDCGNTSAVGRAGVSSPHATSTLDPIEAAPAETTTVLRNSRLLRLVMTW